MAGNMVGNVAFPIFTVTDVVRLHLPDFALPWHGSTKRFIRSLSLGLPQRCFALRALRDECLM
jgi:hypothetical protein